MADIFREVDEDLRRERYERLWKRYGKYAIAAAVLLVAAVGGHQAWQSIRDEQRLEASDAYAAALEAFRQDDPETGERALAELADPSEGGYGLLAAFSEAGRLAEAGETDRAVEAFDAIASGGDSVPDALASAARLKAALLLLDDGRSGDAADRVEDLANAGSAFRPLALEVQALAALSEGEREQALERYREISEDPTAPAGVRSRATQMLAALES